MVFSACNVPSVSARFQRYIESALIDVMCVQFASVDARRAIIRFTFYITSEVVRVLLLMQSR
jgi:hypothetical protein